METSIKEIYDSKMVVRIMILVMKGKYPAEISKDFNVTEQTVSKYLSDLKKVNLIKGKKEGRKINYSISREGLGRLWKKLIEDYIEDYSNFLKNSSEEARKEYKTWYSNYIKKHPKEKEKNFQLWLDKKTTKSKKIIKALSNNPIFIDVLIKFIEEYTSKRLEENYGSLKTIMVDWFVNSLNIFYKDTGINSPKIKTKSVRELVDNLKELVSCTPAVFDTPGSTLNIILEDIDREININP